MTLIFAQIKKDLLCQRRPFIVWGIFTVLALCPTSILHFLPQERSPDPSSPTSLVILVALGATLVASIAFSLLGLLFGVPILVIRVVHTDVLQGTTAFWLTRPVPRLELLIAKALLIAVLPLPLLLLSGEGFHFGNEGHFWATELALIAAFAAVSSITTSTQKVMIYAGCLLFLKSILTQSLTTIWTYVQGAGHPPSSGLSLWFSTWGHHLNCSSSDFFQFCYFIGFSLVFVHQYLTLQRRKSVLILIGVITLISVLQTYLHSNP